MAFVTVPEFRAWLSGVPGSGRVLPARTVELVEEGRSTIRWEVLHGDRRLGFIWRGSRTYSPPTHKGSRIARMHREVPEWHAQRELHGPGRDRIRKDTRRGALMELIAQAELNDDRAAAMDAR